MNTRSAKQLVPVMPETSDAMSSRGGAAGPTTLKLERRVDGQLWASRSGQQAPVWVSRCFPWTEPSRFISLRDTEDEEFALVRDLADLPAGSRAALETSLAEAGFVLEIVGVESCEEEVEIRTWVVRTRQGRRSFQTRRDEWPRDAPGGGLLISDISGDLFYVPDTESLDARSRSLLWAFVN